MRNVEIQEWFSVSISFSKCILNVQSKDDGTLCR